ncbi:hypothetical protein [Sphingobacterium lactis]|uniref:hypothetical protein n=1 Tax=Sphingobacterium lactis TaxID=797291 RepID=UPI003DA361D6
MNSNTPRAQSAPKSTPVIRSLKVVQKNSINTIEKEMVVDILDTIVDQVVSVKEEVISLKEKAKLGEHNLTLDIDEICDLNRLCTAAVCYNEECNEDYFNEIFDILISAKNGDNAMKIINTIQLLDKVAFLQRFIHKLHEQTKDILAAND